MINCTKCGGIIKEIPTPNMVHKAKRVCEKCGAWYGWVRKDENINKRTKTSKYEVSDIIKYHNFFKEFCFFCLRNREQLGVKETLTVDHIDENPNNDELENLQILCTACHKLKNWVRLYMNWHLNGKDGFDK